MSDPNINGWTVSTLRQYLENMILERDRFYDQRFTDQDKAVTSALRAAQDAVTKAEIASDKRFEGVNEFRSALADQQRDLLTRREYEAQNDAVVGRLDRLSSQVSVLEGTRGGIVQTWALVAAGFGGVVAVVSIIIAIITHH